MKETLTTKFADDVLPLAPNGVADDLQVKEGIKIIHRSSVANTIDSQPNNKVLNRPPPDIDKTEAYLPRSTRTTLAQLRSGYSPHLQSYMARIRPTDNVDICPDCNNTGHTTMHIFSCPAKPTELGAKTGSDPGLLDDND